MKNLIIYVIALYFGLIGGYRLAHAESIPAVPSTYAQLIKSWQSSSYISSTPEGACSQQIVGGWSFQSVEMDGLYRAACRFKRSEDSLIATVAYANAVMGCNAGDRLVDGGMCETYTCPSGYTKNPDGISCNRQSCPTGQLSSGRYLMNSPPSSSFCSGGCYVSFSGVWPSHTDGTNLYGEGTLDYSGDYVGECTGSDVPPSGGGSAPPATPPDQQGECTSGNSVTINGTTTCMPGDTGTGDGGDTGDNGDDDTGEDDGTGEDDTGEDDGTGEDDTGDEDGTEDDFCAKNPDVSICKDRTASGECESFSCSGDAIDCSIARASWESACQSRKRKFTEAGNCDSAPTCEGDAIGCAIAKVQWKSHCLFNAAQSVIDDGKKWIDGTKGDEINNAQGGKNNPFSINLPSISPTSGGGGQCPGDVQAMGITVPLSQFCWVFEAMGFAMVTAAWLIAAIIIGRGL